MLNEFFSLVTEMKVSKKELTGFVTPKNQNDITNLLTWNDNHSDQFQLNKTDITIGENVGFTLKPILQDGFGYASYEHYFENKTKWWDNLNLETIVEHQWLVFSKKNTSINSQNLEKIIELLQLLKGKDKVNGLFYSKSDTVIVFFNQKPFELSLKPQNAADFINLLKKLDEKKIKAITELCSWFDGNIEKEHFHAKKNAFSVAVTDYLTEKEGSNKHDICHLLENVVNINHQTVIQYELYLEDFSYSKFVKKIEERGAKFITRINEALSKSVTQVLGLPVATAVFNFAKLDIHWVSILSLIVYASLCGIVLFNQSKLLDDIKKEVELFENKLPKNLKNDLWGLNHKTIKNQIKYQSRLIKFLWCIIGASLIYAFLIGFTLLEPFITELIEAIGKHSVN
ncbi:hypothetical protein A9G34_01445 [Gilliamella sp. Choc4-2]|jgi:predicted house-cleaning NTP pyrophosphatase (Maf/HAM1 superfamily)|nr:hypothetical protein A9G34_01445 [Gilliamella apicola]